MPHSTYSYSKRLVSCDGVTKNSRTQSEMKYTVLLLVTVIFPIPNSLLSCLCKGPSLPVTSETNYFRITCRKINNCPSISRDTVKTTPLSITLHSQKQKEITTVPCQLSKEAELPQLGTIFHVLQLHKKFPCITTTFLQQYIS